MVEEEEESIIPGLTDDVAALILSRFPQSNFRVLSQVCRRWKTLLRSEDFTGVRKSTGTAEEFTCVLMEQKHGTIVYGEVFDSSGNKVGRIPNVPYTGPLKMGYGVTVLNEKILFIGGYTRTLCTNVASADVYEFSPATNSWRKLEDMNIPRYSFSLAVVDGLLYVIRGCTNYGYWLSSYEVYNPETNQWTIKDSPNLQSGFGFAFSFKSKLYVLDKGNTTINIYDTKTKTWEMLNSEKLITAYSYTVLRNKVYVLDSNMPECMEVYDPEENSWTTVIVPTEKKRQRYRVWEYPITLPYIPSTLGVWNNKVLLFLGRSIVTTKVNDFDIDKGSKWSDCRIKPSGYHLSSVLIKF